MHLSILSNLKSQKKTRTRLLSKISIVLLIVICFFSYGMMCNAQAEKNSVSVEVMSKKEIKSKEFTANLKVKFNDMSYYNDELFISYHVYDTPNPEKTTTYAYFENERYPLVLDENGSANLELAVDCSKYDFDEAYIQFDIVDTQNAYWFYLTDNVQFELDKVHMKYSILGAFAEKYIDEIRTHPVIFTFNTIAVVSFVGAVVIVRKKKLFTFKRANCDK